MQYLIIDRLEGNFAVCENEEGKQVLIEAAKLPAQAGEGSVLCSQAGVLVLDHELTQRLRGRNICRQKQVFGDE